MRPILCGLVALIAILLIYVSVDRWWTSAEPVLSMRCVTECAAQ